uniref:von Willebrand factor A domain-containing protein 5A-like n=1 Tax=Haplochromis burtoni TaxID=8153 RepID=A0A3Q2XDZ7_HAPBU
MHKVHISLTSFKIPLKSIEVELQVRDHVATVVSTLNYENKEDKPSEAVFVFPLPGDAAVCHFSAKIRQTQIVAEVKEKQKVNNNNGLDLYSTFQGTQSTLQCHYSFTLAFTHWWRQATVVATAVKLAAGHKFDRDVELLIYYKDAHQPTAVVEAGQASAEPGSLMGDSVVMVSLYPEFPQSVMSSVASCGEFVFLMDRSGSMMASLSFPCSLKDTLLLLLKSLPMGCYFNIYGFGSRYEHIFPVEYTQQTMEEALKSVEQIQANLGGTAILEPLKHIYSQPCIPSQPRQLFVFTDGEVGNTKEVIDLVKKNSDSHRCFSFGIGEGASSALINGMAKEGGGHAQFITGTDRMQAKVMQSLRFALQPTVVDFSVTWDLPKEVSVTVLSPPITALFQGQRSLIYAQLTGQVRAASSPEGCVTVKYSLTLEQKMFFLCHVCRLTVHRLGARTLIRSLELEERESRGQQDGEVKKKLVRLSVQSGVSSSFTAFIAVNKDNSRVIQGPLVRRNIPTPSEFILNPQTKTLSGFCLIFDFPVALLKQPPRDPFMHLVSLQKASGSWLLDPDLATALGKTSEQANSEVWATILALVWLHAFKVDAKDEWEFLAMKAASWIHAQNAPCVSECVESGNVLLGCGIKKEDLGL